MLLWMDGSGTQEHCKSGSQTAPEWLLLSHDSKGFLLLLFGFLATLSSMTRDIKSLVGEVPTMVSAPWLPCLNKLYLVHIILKT